MIRTVSAQMAERHVAWQQEQDTHHMAQKFPRWFLGILPAHQYTLKQPHGSFSLQIEEDTQS